jgi:hypothetical protein
MKKLFFIVALLQLGLVLPCAPGTAHAQPPYSNADFNGTWGFGVSGTVILEPPSQPPPANCVGWTPASAPIALEGTLTGDGKGNVTGTQTFNVRGLVCSGTLINGTYSVNPDGTGVFKNVTFKPASGSPPECVTTVGRSAFTFSNGINHIDLAGTDCFQVTSGTATKQ